MRAVLALSLALFSLAAIEANAAPQEAELKTRFRERLSAIRQLKDTGKIGETTEGMLAAVGQVDDTAGALISAENADRSALYQIIAERTGEPPAEVAKQAAIRNYRDATPEHYLRLKDGRWVQKKQVGAQPTG